MTEAEWLSCTDPVPMLEFVRSHVSDRKLRLFAVACCRRVSHMLAVEARECLELAERVAEGLAGPEERKAGRDRALHAPWLMDDAFRSRRGPAKAAVCDALARHPYEAALLTAWRTRQLVPDRCDLLRDIVPTPFRPAKLDPAWLAWNGGVVKRLAEDICEQKASPAGTLDPIRLSVLADALEECGADAGMVGHLRGPGPHWRGCHVLDLLTGRSCEQVVQALVVAHRGGLRFLVRLEDGREVVAAIPQRVAREMFRVVPGDRVRIVGADRPSPAILEFAR
jgi:translation initiation factor IF-1